ncbi:hypothetical protein FHG87_019236 [Trinorchestia longiramus]|nr:hypothetical protein FHG87_019236 [Trinorchestia longiramus]
MCRDRLREFRSKAGLPVEINVQYDTETNSVDVVFSDSPPSELLHVDSAELFKLLNQLSPLYVAIKLLHEEIQKLRSGVHQHNNKDKFDDQVHELKKQLHSIKAGIERVSERIICWLVKVVAR